MYVLAAIFTFRTEFEQPIWKVRMGWARMYPVIWCRAILRFIHCH